MTNEQEIIQILKRGGYIENIYASHPGMRQTNVYYVMENDIIVKKIQGKTFEKIRTKVSLTAKKINSSSFSHDIKYYLKDNDND